MNYVSENIDSLFSTDSLIQLQFKVFIILISYTQGLNNNDDFNCLYIFFLKFIYRKGLDSF